MIIIKEKTRQKMAQTIAYIGVDIRALVDTIKVYPAHRSSPQERIDDLNKFADHIDEIVDLILTL